MGNATVKEDSGGAAMAEEDEGNRPIGYSNPSIFKPQITSSSWATGDDSLYDQQPPCIPTLITWSYGGREVSVEGTWDNYTTRKQMKRSGKDFIAVTVLHPGVYRYRFVVDGELRYSPDQPGDRDDESGTSYNILDLVDYLPDDVSSVSAFKPPESPDSSYDDRCLGPDDFAKEPPGAPPHLSLTLLNEPQVSARSRPAHVVLDHLYMRRDGASPAVVALGSSARFRSKYVTVVLYTNMKR